MSRYTGARLCIMRALGVNLPGFSSKSIEDNPQPPGQHGGQSRRKSSLHAVRLHEKQKLRFHYGLTERQLRTVAEQAARRRGSTAALIAERLELRLDNVVFRAGFVRTNPAARQLVRHRHILVNDRVVDIPSAGLRPGDVVAVRERSRHVVLLHQARGAALAKPDWLDVDHDTLTARVAAVPSTADIPFPIEMQLVVEFYL